MKQRFRPIVEAMQPLLKWRGWLWIRWSLVGAIAVVLLSLLLHLAMLPRASAAPVDAVLVLGGSVRREIYVAQTAQQQPEIPILISKGSPDPCIRLIFEREQTKLDPVWLENCADSTFSNFVYSTPILKRWQVHHIRLVTSPTHLPRAVWMARIILGAQGLWVEPDIVAEKGIPGNRESRLKTGLDVTRSLLWALVSQGYAPQCRSLTHLPDVDLAVWQKRGFKCEHQAHIRQTGQ